MEVETTLIRNPDPSTSNLDSGDDETADPGLSTRATRAKCRKSTGRVAYLQRKGKKVFTSIYSPVTGVQYDTWEVDITEIIDSIQPEEELPILELRISGSLQTKAILSAIVDSNEFDTVTKLCFLDCEFEDDIAKAFNAKMFPQVTAIEIRKCKVEGLALIRLLAGFSFVLTNLRIGELTGDVDRLPGMFLLEHLHYEIRTQKSTFYMSVFDLFSLQTLTLADGNLSGFIEAVRCSSVALPWKSVKLIECEISEFSLDLAPCLEELVLEHCFLNYDACKGLLGIIENVKSLRHLKMIESFFPLDQLELIRDAVKTTNIRFTYRDYYSPRSFNTFHRELTEGATKVFIKFDMLFFNRVHKYFWDLKENYQTQLAEVTELFIDTQCQGNSTEMLWRFIPLFTQLKTLSLLVTRYQRHRDEKFSIFAFPGEPPFSSLDLLSIIIQVHSIDEYLIGFIESVLTLFKSVKCFNLELDVGRPGSALRLLSCIRCRFMTWETVETVTFKSPFWIHAVNVGEWQWDHPTPDKVTINHQ